MDLAALVSQWTIGKVIKIQRYSQGQHNQTYYVETERGKYSLRIYNYKKPNQINFEVSLLKALKGLPIPEPLALSNRKYLLKVGKKYALLYRYLPGEHLQAFTERQLRGVGAVIGKFHRKSKKFHWTQPRYQFYHLPNSKIKKFELISKRAGIPYLRYLPSIIRELKASRLSSDLPQGPIHVDIKPENTLFYKGQLSGIIDFDNSYVGPFLLDLAKSMVWFGTRNKKFHVANAIAIYRGYIQERALTPLEFRELYQALKFAFLSHIFVDYYMRAINATSKEYFTFIIHDLYAAYKTFTLREDEFYTLLYS